MSTGERFNRRASRGPGRGACLITATVVMLAARASADDLFVDPGAPPGGDGSSVAPARTIEDALSRVAPGSRSTVHLAPGLYRDESFPIVLPTRAESIRVLGPESGVAQIRPSGRVAAIELDDVPAAELRFEFERIHFEGGDAALFIAGAPRSRIELDVSRCRFVGQKLQGVAAVAGEMGGLHVSVRDSVFEGAAVHAIDLGTRLDGELEVDVTGNRVTGHGLGQDSLLPHHGVSLYLDTAAGISGRIAGNTLENTGNGVLVSTAASVRKAGTASLEIASNFVVGEPDTPGMLRHGVSVHGRGAARLELRIVCNTFAGGEGHGLHVPRAVGSDEFCFSRSVKFAGNVVWDFPEGAVGSPELFPFSAADSPSPKLPECVDAWGNGLGGATPSLAGNSSATPEDFVDVAARDFRLAAGSSLHDLDALGEVGGLDATGGCRRVDANGDGLFTPDVGAFEFRGGRCVDDVRAFGRGDCNEDHGQDISDASAVFGFLFLGSRTPRCLDACDVNDDGGVNVSDGIYLLNFLFLSGDAPPTPFPEAGTDGTADSSELDCLR